MMNQSLIDYQLNVEWDTPLGFIALQRVHSTRDKEDLIYCGPVYWEKTGKKTKVQRCTHTVSEKGMGDCYCEGWYRLVYASLSEAYRYH